MIILSSLFCVKAPDSDYRYLEASDIRYGRCERIRTFDPLHPMQVRYQAAPHTDQVFNYSVRKTEFCGGSVCCREHFANGKQLAANQCELVGTGIASVFELAVKLALELAVVKVCQHGVT